MDWIFGIQRAIDYVEEHLLEEIDYETVAKEAYSSTFYFQRVFGILCGFPLGDYIRMRRLSLAGEEIQKSNTKIIEIAMKYGYDTPESFTRAFTRFHGITPSEARKGGHIQSFTRISVKVIVTGGNSMTKTQNIGDVKIYFVQIPAHKFLHIRNYTSIGYWDFWQKQAEIKGQDCETVCGLLDGIKGKLDDIGGSEEDAGSGQLMAWINAPTGRICSWGIPLAEAYGVRLPADYVGEIPMQMQIMDVPEGEYIVFEHGPFDFATESEAVEAKIETAMKDFDWQASGYTLDLTPERVFYFYHDCKRFFRYVRPVVRTEK